MFMCTIQHRDESSEVSCHKRIVFTWILAEFLTYFATLSRVSLFTCKPAEF